MKIKLCCFSLLFFSFVLQAQTISPEIEEEIQRRVQNKINPSIAIGVLLPNGHKQYYNYGRYLNRELSIPDSTTLYEIGSVTKTFTALLIDEELNPYPETGLEHYFPKETRLNNTLETITLEAIRNHIAGLPRLSDQFSPNNWTDPFKGYSEDKLKEELVMVQADTTHTWSYSNFGYGILGQALEEELEKNFGQLMSSLFLKANMSHTFTKHDTNTDNLMAIPTNIGTPNNYWHFEGPSRYAGGLISCTRDLLHYLEYQSKNNAMFQNGEIGNVIETGIDNLGEDQLFYKDGWFVFKPMEGTEILLHNGGTGGYTSVIAFNKRTNTGVVALSNSVSLVDDIALKLIHPFFQLNKPQRTIAYELADKIDIGSSNNLKQTYLDLKAKKHPNNIIDIYWLERFHFGNGNFVISNQLSDIMLLELPEDWEVLDIKGQNLEELGHFTEANKMYKAAYRLDPDNEQLLQKIERTSSKPEEN